VRPEPRDDRGPAAAALIRIVVPHAGARGKTRLGASRAELSSAMLGHVLAAATSVGRTWVVSPDRVEGADWISDPGGGQGAAVEAALREIGPGPVLVVNSDLPSVTANDLHALHDAIPENGIAVAPARDGTTNALGLSDTTLFAPLYGPGSAARFRAHAEHAVDVDRPGLRDDVDTPADLVTA
jgi:2-phospho-L-lactate/phosphoenolpyruvate guanylyltransferase